MRPMRHLIYWSMFMHAIMITLVSAAQARCIATFVADSSSMENPGITIQRGKIIPQVTELVMLAGGGKEDRTFGPTQYIQTNRGPAICFYKDYCYPAKDIMLTGCAISQPDQISPHIRFLSPASK
jgi:hypothetical protein